MAYLLQKIKYITTPLRPYSLRQSDILFIRNNAQSYGLRQRRYGLHDTRPSDTKDHQYNMVLYVLLYWWSMLIRSILRPSLLLKIMFFRIYERSIIIILKIVSDFIVSGRSLTWTRDVVLYVEVRLEDCICVTVLRLSSSGIYWSLYSRGFTSSQILNIVVLYKPLVRSLLAGQLFVLLISLGTLNKTQPHPNKIW